MSHSVIKNPTGNDILFGRGKSTINHLGNIRFRTMIQKVKPMYKCLGNGEKSKFAKNLMNHVHSTGGRFLEKNERGQWVPADKSKIKEKILQALRQT